MSIEKQIDAVPIPGANYTEDTRQFPWHKPPDLTDYEETIEYLISKFSETDRADRITSLLEYGVDVTTLTSMLLMGSIGRGKFSVDMALLVAGPLARYLELIAKTNGVKKIELGFENKKARATVEDLKMMAGVAAEEDINLDPTGTVEAVEQVSAPMNEPMAQEPNSLMGMPTETSGVATSQEQAMMLGQQSEEEEEEI